MYRLRKSALQQFTKLSGRLRCAGNHSEKV